MTKMIKKIVRLILGLTALTFFSPFIIAIYIAAWASDDYETINSLKDLFKF